MSKLSDFLGGLWHDLEAPFVGAITSVKQAFEAKDAQAVVNSITGLVKVGAIAIENGSTSAKVAGTTITGPDKKVAVQGVVLGAINPIIGGLEIPGVDTKVAQDFFGGLLSALIGHLIDDAVASLNKHGWKI